ncbi:hypothetical protein Hanom_Chr16g01423171 [Helianthus anomalus]
MQESKRLSERVKPKLLTGGRNQPLFPLSELLLKKVYVESLWSMSASTGPDGESFTAQSTQGRLSLMLSREVEVLLVSSMLVESECGPNNSPWLLSCDEYLIFIIRSISFIFFGESFLRFNIILRTLYTDIHRNFIKRRKHQ